MGRTTGIPASPGIAIGRVALLHAGSAKVPRYHVDPEQIPAELDRLQRGIALTVEQLDGIRQSLGQNAQADILDAHRMMAADPELVRAATMLIEEELLCPEWAVRRYFRDVMEQLAGPKVDNYIAERRADMDEVCQRIIANLVGEPTAIDPATLPSEAVLVCEDLPTAHAASLLSSGRVRGLVAFLGSKTSHTAILARALEIPAVVGMGRPPSLPKAGDAIAIDGARGEVFFEPSAEEIATLREGQAAERLRGELLSEERDLPATTLDGKRLSLLANIEFPEEVPTVLAHGGEGVGLYRTEFLYLNRKDLPTEEEHYQAYAAILRQMGGRPVVLRTLDLGGDKLLGQAQLGHRTHEANPALGLRAIRFTLRYGNLFRTQLRAIWRASTLGPVRLLLPMVSALSELREARRQIEAVRAELLREGAPVAERMPVGIMVETPAAALTADRLARECDFFSIGTNDLIQYSLAIDRGNREVAYLYRPMHLGVLRLIRLVIEGARESGIDVSMCGEMAGDPAYTLILLALGLDSLSMNPADIPVIKRVLRGASLKDARQLLDAAMSYSSTDEIERFVLREMHQRFPELVPSGGAVPVS